MILPEEFLKNLSVRFFGRVHILCPSTGPRAPAQIHWCCVQTLGTRYVHIQQTKHVPTPFKRIKELWVRRAVVSGESARELTKNVCTQGISARVQGTWKGVFTLVPIKDRSRAACSCTKSERSLCLLAQRKSFNFVVTSQYDKMTPMIQLFWISLFRLCPLLQNISNQSRRTPRETLFRAVHVYLITRNSTLKTISFPRYSVHIDWEGPGNEIAVRRDVFEHAHAIWEQVRILLVIDELTGVYLYLDWKMWCSSRNKKR